MLSGLVTNEQNLGARMTRCRFFFSGNGCARGDQCNYSHEIETIASEDRQSVSTAHSRPPCKFYAAGFCRWGNRCEFTHSRPAHRSQNNKGETSEDCPLSKLSDAELKSLRKNEIQQLKKRFPRRVDVDACKYRFVFKITDPDWPYEVKELNLEVMFPDLYPKHMLSVDVFDSGRLPETLSSFLVKKMNDWLTEQQEASLHKDKVNLAFKPFIKWLDKSAEKLFTDGLLMYKRELAAKAAGFTFVQHKDTKANSRSDSHSDDVQEIMQSMDQATLSTQKITPEDICQTEISQKSDIAEHEQQTESSNMKSQEALLPESEDEEINEITPTLNSKLNPARRGTELRLKNLQLMESTASLHCTVLRIGIRCTRCKTVHHISLTPERPCLVVCDKCRSKMSLVFHASLMHVSSNTVGFFDLELCQPFDLIAQDCQFVAGCLDCGKENLVHGLQQETLRSFWCISCHKKMSLSIEKGSFILLNDGAPIIIGADTVLIAKKVKPKAEPKILAEGKPLPDFGACMHYKKSFRWFRFPCCGKLYPCDKCHDEKEFDHEMELATRMVCGYCSKEQAFSNIKPCSSCDTSMTRAKSSHWEGGQGCRNKLLMAKGDKHKFAGSNKTISNKAIVARGKPGAPKTTHVRHTQ